MRRSSAKPGPRERHRLCPSASPCCRTSWTTTTARSATWTTSCEPFFAWLEEQGLSDSTYVLVTSDHGEEFLEHGRVGHLGLPHEQLLRVPLIVVGPEVSGGRRIPEVVSHLDLQPSILELAGAPQAPHARGRSFVKRIAGEAGPPDAAGLFVSEAWSLPREYLAPALALRTGGRKLLLFRDASGEHEAVFDLNADPGEQRDLTGLEPAEAQRMRDAMSRYRQELLELGGQLTAEGPSTPRADDLDPEQADKLRALGYIE